MVAVVVCTAAVIDPIAPDIRQESQFLPTPPAFDSPVRGSLSQYCHDVWCGETRMVGYPMMKKSEYDYSF